ncbi:MAG: hypothetical protein RX318_07245, partial [bacterium]|nr:hypothetical protein [bacterium]
PRPGGWPVAPDGAVHGSVARVAPSKGRPRARPVTGAWTVEARVLSGPVVGTRTVEAMTLSGPVTGTRTVEAMTLSGPVVGTRIDPPKAEAWPMARPLLPRSPVAAVIPQVAEIFPPVAEILSPVEAVLPPVAPPLQALLFDLADERRVFVVGLGQARGLLGGPTRRREDQGHEGGQHQDDAAGAPDLVDTHGSPPFIESE